MKLLNSTIEKYNLFCSIQRNKISFVRDMMEMFKYKLNGKPSNRHQEYLDNIYGNIYLIQEISEICLSEIESILNSNKNIGCTAYIKLMELKISLSLLCNVECESCCELIKSCMC